MICSSLELDLEWQKLDDDVNLTQTQTDGNSPRYMVVHVEAECH